MNDFSIIPSIDLRNGKVVRLQQGDFTRQLDYDLDPVETAKCFARDGAAIMHLVDLDGAKAGHVAQVALIRQITAHAGIVVQAGGGVRSTDDIDLLLIAGVTRVVVGTAAIQNWQWFERLLKSSRYFQKLVLAIDAKEGFVATHGWTETSTLHVLDIASRVKGKPLAGLLFTDVARDGMLQGPNVELTASIAQHTDVPVIASGGVGSLEHISPLLGQKIAGVILGRSLHDGRVKLRDAIDLVAGSKSQRSSG